MIAYLASEEAARDRRRVRSSTAASRRCEVGMRHAAPHILANRIDCGFVDSRSTIMPGYYRRNCTDRT